ncbi:unnamed protein product [Heterobilharzia americana]|nr:unnamed protein product [Heterobilharzia americana]CAH8580944.1 unnamed protein product [Heterobilharzia americana]
MNRKHSKYDCKKYNEAKDRLRRFYSVKRCNESTDFPVIESAASDQSVIQNFFTKTISRFNMKGVTTLKLSELNIRKHLDLRANRRSPETKFQVRRKTSSSEKSMWPQVRRRFSEQSVSLPGVQSASFPSIRLFYSSFFTKKAKCERSGVNLAKGMCTVGHILFTYVYSRKLQVLNVMVSEVITDNSVTSNVTTIPNNIRKTLVVYLRPIQHVVDSLRRHEKNTVSYFTRSFLTSKDPSFVQSFKFYVSLDEMQRTQLTFTILRPSAPYTPKVSFRNMSETALRRRRIYSISEHCKSRGYAILREMRFIGEAFYDLNQCNCSSDVKQCVQQKIYDSSDFAHKLKVYERQPYDAFNSDGCTTANV